MLSNTRSVHKSRVDQILAQEEWRPTGARRPLSRLGAEALEQPLYLLLGYSAHHALAYVDENAHSY